MSRNREDYIKSIYELGGHKKRVSNKEIAEDLIVSAPSVSEMIKKLVKDGFLEYEEYKGVKLTDIGIDEAKKIRKRHLLWEIFLVEKLGYNWKDVDEEADKLEHVMSDRLEVKLDEYLGHPKYCPHGTPIDLDDEELQIKKISEMKLGEESYIIRVVDKIQVINFMEEIGLNLGDEISLIKNDEEEIIIDMEGKQISLNRNIADMIFIS